MKIKILLFILSVVSIKINHAQVGQLKVNETFDLKVFETMAGEEVHLESMDHKVFVMNFWNNGCKGCELERPYLNELYHKYENQGVVFWSITMNTKEKLESHLIKHPIDWDVKGDIDFMGLRGDETFLIKCMPTTIIISKDRKVMYAQCGPILEGQTGDDFKKLIDEALSKQNVN